MKKNLLKKVLALALSATMALTPVVSYAGEEVITEEVVWEETANDQSDESGEQQSSGDEEDQVYSDEQSFSTGDEQSGDEQSEVEETVGFEESEEDTASDDTFYAFSDDTVTEEDNEVDFVTEDAYYADNQDVLEAIGEEQVASDEAALFGDEVVDEGNVVDEQVAGEEAAWYDTDAAAIEAHMVCRSGEAGTAGTYYGTLVAAATAVQNGQTITMIDDSTETAEVVFDHTGESFTLDLAGHSVTVNADLWVKNGELTLTSSAANGKIIDGQNDAAIYVSSNNNSAKGGLIIDSDNVTVQGAQWGIAFMSNATVTISGGTIETIGQDGEGYAVSGNGTSTGAVLNVTGGTITGRTLGVYFPGSNTLNISGGTITGKTGIYVKSGTTTITGGIITGNGDKAGYGYYGNGGNPTGDAIVIDSCNYPSGTPTLKISGTPTLMSTNNKKIGYYVWQNSGSEIDKGVLLSDQVYDLSVNGPFVWAANEDASFKFRVDAAVASLTSGTGASATTTYYATFEEAVEAAAAGQTIKVLKDITLTDNCALDVAGTVTVDLSKTGGGAYTITYGNYSIQLKNKDAELVINQAEHKVTSDVSGYCVIKETGEGTYTYSLVKAVAQIGTGDTAKQYATLEAAFAASVDGDTIKLLDNITPENRIFVNAGPNPAYAGNNNRYATTTENKSLTLDLNSYNITSSSNSSNIALAGGSLTITGQGKISTSAEGIAPVEIRGTGDLTLKRTLTIDKNVTLEGTLYGLNVFGSNNNDDVNNIEVNINGKVKGMLFVLGNLGNTNNDITVNVNDGAVVDASAATGSGEKVKTGIALNGYGTVNVYPGSTIKGESGIEVRAGKLNIYAPGADSSSEEAVIQATSQSFSIEANGNGTTTKGVGVVVAQHGTKLPIEVKIEGGKLTGCYGLYVGDPENTQTYDAKFEIKGGYFKGTTQSVSADNYHNFITGGLFSTEPAAGYIKKDYVAAESGNSEYPYTIGEAVASVTFPADPGPAQPTFYASVADAQAAVKEATTAETVLAAIPPIKILSADVEYAIALNESIVVDETDYSLNIFKPSDDYVLTSVPVSDKVTQYTCTYPQEEQPSDTLTVNDESGAGIKLNAVDPSVVQSAEDGLDIPEGSTVSVELDFIGQKLPSQDDSVVFRIEPVVTVKVTTEGQTTTPVDGEPISNESLKKYGTDFSFKLYLDGAKYKQNDIVKVVHVSTDPAYPEEISYLPVMLEEGSNKVYVLVKTDHFSTFTLTNITNTIVDVTVNNGTGVENVTLAYNNVTVNAENGKPQQIPGNIDVKITATASSGYTIKTITLKNGSEDPTPVTSGEKKRISDNAVINVEATKKSTGGSGSTGTTTTTYTYKLTLSSNPTGATLTGAGSYSYTSGSAAPTATATAGDMEGYTFTGWQENGTTVSTSKTYSVVMNKDRNLVAVYTKNEPTTAEAFIAEVAALPDATKATSENRKAVDKALADYAALPAADKTKADVVAAKKTLDGINDAVTADEVADKIEALPASPKLDDKAAVEAADKAYKALTDAQKKLVPAKDVTALENAVKAIKEAEADKEKADAVDKLIKELPDKPTLADKEKVEAANDAYKALTDAQKSYIPTADQEKLAAAVKAIEDAEAAKKKEDQAAADAVKKMIDDLPAVADVKPENKTSVDAVQKQYDKLTEDQKALVPQAEKDKLEALQKALNGDDQKIAEQFTAAVNAVPGNKAGEGKGLLDKATAIYQTMTDAQKALVTTDTMDLYNEEVEAFKKGRKFRSGDGYYKVLSNGDVTYLYPADKDATGVVVPNQVKKGKFMFKVIKISTLAFDGCTKLKWVVIHKNIRVIGEYAFNETSSLIKINIKGSGFVSGKVIDAFGKAGKKDGESLTVKVPSAKVSSYNSLFKGEGKLNPEAKVVKAA